MHDVNLKRLSTPLAKSEIAPHFSHIYVERRALEYPHAKKIIARFPRATVIEISNYKEVFNRPRQNFRIQKESQKLILAVRTDHFAYPAPEVVQNMGNAHCYYNSLILNCIYDCDYCFLQGLFPSANIVVFVNSEDYFSATKELLLRHPVYMCISYETDLLAFEKIAGYCREWIEFARKESELSIEIRTKSGNFSAISDLIPSANVILAWTLSPQSVIESHEPKTASLSARLKAISDAMAKGWKVRLCFDPVLNIEGAGELYRDLIGQVSKSIEIRSLLDISIGAFRMNKRHLKKIQSIRNDSPILFHPFIQYGELSCYDQGLESRLCALIKEEILRYDSSADLYQANSAQ